MMMEQSPTRTYRRRRRKLACRSCNARHIRCWTPGGTLTVGGQRRERRCQACLDADEECVYDQPTTFRTSRLLPCDLGEQSLLGDRSAPLVLDPIPTSDRSESVDHQTRVHSQQEGSGNLLERLTDDLEDVSGDKTGEGSNKVMYFGNDSVWSHSLQNARRRKSLPSISSQNTGEQPRHGNIHYSISGSHDKQLQGFTQEQNVHKQEEMQLLRRKGAFCLPSVEVQKELLDSYFRWLHPLQPIIDKEQFLREFEAGKISVLLLQALFSVGTTCCNENIIRRHWSNRRAAQFLFYGRARALYDADFEQNRVVVVQALFLMAFWWGSPTDLKDFSHWLSASIHMAQVMGMHRSTKHSSLPIRERRLWKRIWWTLYVRDHFDAASLGRPMMINDEDCDIEPLLPTDFEAAENGEQSSGALEQCIGIAELATFIGRIIRDAQLNKQQDEPAEGIASELSTWEKRLPQRIRAWDEEHRPEQKLFSAMVFFGLHFCKILLHRKMFSQIKPELQSSSVAFTSANAVTRIVEELLADGLLARAQVHFIVVLFASFTIFIASLEQSQGSRHRVMQHKAQLCLLGLAEFRDTWHFVDWMYQLFSNLLERLRIEADSGTTYNGKPRDRRGHEQSGPPSATAPLPPNNVQPSGNGGLAASSQPLMQDQNWTTDAQTPTALDYYDMFNAPSADSFLDPFMPLDSIYWANQSANYFNYPGAASWPNAA